MFGLALAIHQPVVGLTKRIAVWCTWPWLLLQSPWDLRFAHGNFKQLVGCFFGIHTVHHTKRKARHPHWDHEEHNQYDHPLDLLLQPYPKVSVFTTKATHPQIFEGLAQTHQLMLDGTSAHSPASCASHVNVTRGTSVLLSIAEIPSYLKFCKSGEGWNQTTCPAKGGWQLAFFSDIPGHFTIKTASLQPIHPQKQITHSACRK